MGLMQMSHVMFQGPLAVAADASPWQLYGRSDKYPKHMLINQQYHGGKSRFE